MGGSWVGGRKEGGRGRVAVSRRRKGKRHAMNRVATGSKRKGKEMRKEGRGGRKRKEREAGQEMGSGSDACARWEKNEPRSTTTTFERSGSNPRIAYWRRNNRWTGQ